MQDYLTGIQLTKNDPVNSCSPKFRIIDGQNRKIDNKCGYINLYNDDELVINAYCGSYKHYEDHPLEYLKTASFFKQTAIIITNKYKEIDQYLIIDNMSLEVHDKCNINNELISVSLINDTDPFYVNHLTDIKHTKYDYRFIRINTPKLGEVILRLMHYPDEDLLTSIDIQGTNNARNTVAKGAFIAKESIMWLKTILSIVK